MVTGTGFLLGLWKCREIGCVVGAQLHQLLKTVMMGRLGGFWTALCKDV
jgi:hypothetical protein